MMTGTEIVVEGQVDSTADNPASALVTTTLLPPSVEIEVGSVCAGTRIAEECAEMKEDGSFVVPISTSAVCSIFVGTL